ncbi:hypothetical protein JXB01_04290 [Candidatus Micrarchaeota archaeon]|nr:hypothetical protein [Candidatus Micrarchaeota archaeon]
MCAAQKQILTKLDFVVAKKEKKIEPRPKKYSPKKSVLPTNTEIHDAVKKASKGETDDLMKVLGKLMQHSPSTSPKSVETKLLYLAVRISEYPDINENFYNLSNHLDKAYAEMLKQKKVSKKFKWENYKNKDLTELYYLSTKSTLTGKFIKKIMTTAMQMGENEMVKKMKEGDEEAGTEKSAWALYKTFDYLSPLVKYYNKKGVIMKGDHAKILKAMDEVGKTYVYKMAGQEIEKSDEVIYALLDEVKKESGVDIMNMKNAVDGYIGPMTIAFHFIPLFKMVKEKETPKEIPSPVPTLKFKKITLDKVKETPKTRRIVVETRPLFRDSLEALTPEQKKDYILTYMWFSYRMVDFTDGTKGYVIVNPDAEGKQDYVAMIKDNGDVVATKDITVTDEGLVKPEILKKKGEEVVLGRFKKVVENGKTKFEVNPLNIPSEEFLSLCFKKGIDLEKVTFKKIVYSPPAGIGVAETEQRFSVFLSAFYVGKRG